MKFAFHYMFMLLVVEVEGGGLRLVTSLYYRWIALPALVQPRRLQSHKITHKLIQNPVERVKTTHG